MKSTEHNLCTVVERRGTGAVKWDLMPENRLPLWVADMDFAVAPEIVEAVRRRTEHPVFGYPLPPESLYDAFLEFQNKRHGREIERRHCLIVPGVMPALRAAVALLSLPGEQIVLQPPVYPPFFDAIRSQGRTIVENPLVEAEGRYRMDLEGLERCFQDGARLLLFCSPHNPVGRVWTAPELEALSELCARYDVTVIADEIHADLHHADGAEPAARFVPFDAVTPAGNRAPDAGGTTAGGAGANSPTCLPRTVSLVSPSKTFNIPGASIAFALVQDQELRRSFRAKLSALGLDHPHIFGMVITEAAYRHGGAWLDTLGDRFRDNLNLLEQLCAGSSLKPRLVRPEASFIAWIDFRRFLAHTGLDDESFQNLLRDKAELELSHGPDFGAAGAGFQRINFATSPENLEECFRRLERLK